MTEEDRQDIKSEYHQSLIADALALLGSAETNGIAHLRDGLRRYLVDRIETGGFLRRVLENDLDRAIGHAHPSLTMMQMKTLNMVLGSSFPERAWGSPEKVAAWLREEEEQQ